MKKKALISVLSLLLALIACLMPACGKPADGGDAATEDTASTEPETNAPTDNVILDAGETDYQIVRAMDAPTYEVEATKTVNKALQTVFKDTWDMKIGDDFIKGAPRDHVEENDEKEILIGCTNRKESRDTLAELKPNEYVIKFVDKKLVIIGYDQYATYTAALQFASEVVIDKDNSGVFRLEKDFILTGTASLRKIPINDEATYRMLSWNLGCSVGVAEDAVDVILRYLPDIVALQESDKGIHNNVIAKLLASCSDYKYVQKTHKNSSTLCYTPILYNSSLFTLVDAGVEWLDSRYTGTNTKCLCWAVLRDNDGKTFGMINFHGAVCSNKYKGYENCTSAELNEIAANWRIDNVRQILDVKAAILAKHGDIPITVNGDCNFKEGTTPYNNLIAAGFADAEKTARVKITTGYTTSFSYGKFYTSGKSIDHIFQKGGVDFVIFDIVRDKDVQTASDHCPIFVDFNLK